MDCRAGHEMEAASRLANWARGKLLKFLFALLSLPGKLASIQLASQHRHLKAVPPIKMRIDRRKPRHLPGSRIVVSNAGAKMGAPLRFRAHRGNGLARAAAPGRLGFRRQQP
jgi:hypothetical protein